MTRSVEARDNFVLTVGVGDNFVVTVGVGDNFVVTMTTVRGLLADEQILLIVLVGGYSRPAPCGATRSVGVGRNLMPVMSLAVACSLCMRTTARGLLADEQVVVLVVRVLVDGDQQVLPVLVGGYD